MENMAYPTRMQTSLKALAAACFLALATASLNRLQYPVVVSNMCALGGGTPLGVDSSVLFRRYVDVGPAVRQFCDAYLLSDVACGRVQAEMHERLTSLAHADEFAWIATLQQGTNTTILQVGPCCVGRCPIYFNSLRFSDRGGLPICACI